MMLGVCGLCPVRRGRILHGGLQEGLHSCSNGITDAAFPAEYRGVVYNSYRGKGLGYGEIAYVALK